MPAAKALAFDMYGTLVDPTRIWRQLERYIPIEDALRVSEVWRQKQLEFTFRLTVMGRYEDFDWVTRKALDYALAEAGRELGEEHKGMLMTHYNELERFEDAEPGLKRLNDAGYEMVVFSNGSPSMLEALIEKEGFYPYFQDFISVDEVRVYKPSPRAYRHAADRLERPVGEVCLVSSNPFDLVGAEAVGMRVAWVNRSKGLFDALGSRPATVVESLTGLADALEAYQGR
ncbi:MAG: haloacid dehalogenase type II [Actinomycetota bacterium]|nr:haloacid dehalogenase type II [Actinomycetota bacterium]